jgi:hypothetical protein
MARDRGEFVEPACTEQAKAATNDTQWGITLLRTARLGGAVHCREGGPGLVGKLNYENRG